MPDDDAATPLRSLPTRDDSGVRVVRETGATWLDGSEVVLLERMRSGLPLDSLSDELFATATTWPEQYHLSPSRANILRALDLPSNAIVLEVGAGCGAVTRYLGETCSTVDALEPTIARARVAAARTADLPGVAVFCGEISDVPPSPVYDLVVVVGVLEYVGNGGRDRAPYLTFLNDLRQVLKPGGSLVLAIENSLGAKYLAGAPEDHSGEVFHSVEGYPVDGPARTFNRRRLQELVMEAGFASTHTLGAFPDYKLARLVFDDRLLTEAGPLALQVPRFPSPDWVVDRLALADEELLWAELVDAGVGAEFANSLLLIATTEGRSGRLWSPGRLAAYFSIRRRRAYQVVKRVELDKEKTTVTSSLLSSGSGDGLTVLPYREEWSRGVSLVRVATENPDGLAQLVADWVRLLGERAEQSVEGAPVDVLPHNILYVGSVPRIIDDEWRSVDASLGDVIDRGAILFARDLSCVASTQRWRADSVTDLAIRIAAMAGRELATASVRGLLEREAEFQALVAGGAPGTAAHSSTRDVVLADLLAQFERPTEGRKPLPAWKQAVQDRKDAVEARDLLFATGRRLDETQAELDALRNQIRAGRGPLETRVRAAAGSWARRVVRIARRVLRRLRVRREHRRS